MRAGGFLNAELSVEVFGVSGCPGALLRGYAEGET